MAHKVGAVVQVGQVEALIERAGETARPGREGLARLVERRGHILIEDDLGDHVGERLGGENVVGDGAVSPEAEDAQVDINLRRLAGLLARLAALGREIQALFAVVAVLVLGVDVELIIEVVAVCMLRDDGHEGEMLRRAGFTDPVDGPAGAGALALRAAQQIERDGHLRVRAGGADDADDLALRAARNGVDGEVRDGGLRVCPGGDGGDGVVARGDLDGLLAPVLVGQIEGKGVAFAAGGGGDGERVAAGLLVLQEQRDRAGGGERLRAT